MMNLTESRSFLPRSRRATGWSLVCLPFLVAAWFQFSGEDSEGEPVPRTKSATTAASQSGSRVSASHYEVDASQTGTVIGASASESPGEKNGELNASEVPEDPEAILRATIAGEWEDDYQGKRHLNVSSDGTGTMIVDLDGIGKKLFAARLSFDMEWTLADGYVTMKTLGGEPKSKVHVVLKLYGNEARYKIVELSADRMLLLDGDGKTQYDWRRPNSSVAGATSGTSSQ